MARFYDEVGFGASVETSPGVYEDVIVKRKYYGDVVRNSRRIQESMETVNDGLVLGNSISIVADAYATEKYSAIRYVKWLGTLWKVPNVEVQSPRLILRLGEVYNGQP